MTKYRIIHLPDLHLGARPYKIKELEEDIYLALRDIKHKLDNTDFDYIISTGDIFNTHQPNPEAIYGAYKFFEDYEEKLILINGNHDFKNKNDFNGSDLIDLLTDNLTLKTHEILSEDLHFIKFDYSKNIKEDLKNIKLDPKRFNILILHQGIKEYLKFGSELELNDLRDLGFNYIALGHLHNRHTHKFDNNCTLHYSGSLYPMNKNELNYKAFSIIDIDTESKIVDIKDIPIYQNRKWFKFTIEDSNLEAQIEEIKSTVLKTTEKALIFIELDLNKSNKSKVIDYIKEELESLTLEVIFDLKFKENQKIVIKDIIKDKKELIIKEIDNYLQSKYPDEKEKIISNII